MTEPAWMQQVKKYRKKPVVIEAMYYDGTNADDVIHWGFQAGIYRHPASAGREDSVLVVPTLEGAHHVHPEYYVIKGVEGEFYGCEPGIFEKTYEVADA